MVITGRNGDPKNDAAYDALGSFLLTNAEELNFKHLCGEYPESSAFALWVAANILKTRIIPAVLAWRPLQRSSANKILIYNHYQQDYHSLMLVTS